MVGEKEKADDQIGFFEITNWRTKRPRQFETSSLLMGQI
jgi:hypothetical protein